MQAHGGGHSRRVRRVASLILAAAITLGGLYAAVMYSISWPEPRGLSPRDSYDSGLEGRVFSYLTEQDVNESKGVPQLKVHLGWSQNVWIVILGFQDGTSGVTMLEMAPARNAGKTAEMLRRFKLTARESQAFFRRFDKPALGFHVTRNGGYDGREISFERQRDGRVVSYRGNASLSAQDAKMTRAVDQLVMQHGGYTYLDAETWGISPS
ncbi:MAG: hypothetical protein P8Y58_01395 [Novosphingobium sp.]